MRIAQILHDRAHCIFEAESMPEYPPDQEGNPIILIDITDKPEIREGWRYNGSKFTQPPQSDPVEIEPEPMTVEEARQILTDKNVFGVEIPSDVEEEAKGVLAQEAKIRSRKGGSSYVA